MEKTIEIKNWVNHKVLFSYTCENNSFAKTLEEAVRKNVDLSFANLAIRILSDVDLSNANLKSASFVCSHLNKVNFNGANLKDANFAYSVLTDVTFDNAVGINDQCPKEGSFIGWKKCRSFATNKEYIVKLEIPADAKRCSSTTNKCRCSKANVLDIQNFDGTIADIDYVFSISRTYNLVCYKVNEYVYPDSFNDNFWDECSNGIHFFMNREDAVNY